MPNRGAAAAAGLRPARLNTHVSRRVERERAVRFEICIDVDDVERVVQFYSQGLGLTVIEHHPDWAQLALNEQTVWIMKVAAGP
jgi:catechol-2,3-dioxygenase